MLSGVTFQYIYQGFGSVSVPQVAVRVNNTSATPFDLSLVTYNDDNDTAQFDLAGLYSTSPSFIRNVAVEGDLLTSVTPTASQFLNPTSLNPSTAGGVQLPNDNLASVAIRDFAPNNDIQAKSIQAVAFGSFSQNGKTYSGALANGQQAAALLVSGTDIVPANDLSGTSDTYRVPFGDLQQVGLFIVTNKNGGQFDNKNIAFLVEDTAANGTIENDPARGAVTAMVAVVPTYDNHGNPQNPVVQSILLSGDGGSIATQQTITNSIISNGTMGDLSLQGPLTTNVSASSFFRSITVNGPASSTITATGIDPNQSNGLDPNGGSFGVAGTTFTVNGPFSGKLSAAQGDIDSAIVLNGPLQGGSISAAGAA